MKPIIVLIAGLALFSVAVAAPAQESTPKPRSQNLQLTPELQKRLTELLPRPDLRPRFPDLAVVGIRVVPLRVIERDSLSRRVRLRVRLEVDVRNIGLVNYESKPNQQGLYVNYLYDNKLQIADLPFQNVRSGQTLTLRHEMDWGWNSSDEFPQGLKATIGFDPDLFIDGNEKNDDLRQSNNQKELVGTTIQETLRTYIGRH
jgi:hypothetical protein